MLSQPLSVAIVWRHDLLCRS